MIQRLQTVYLALVAIIGMCMYFFPLVSLVPSAAGSLPTIYHISALQVTMLENGTESMLVRYWPTLILTAVIIAFSVVTILQYKKRLQQIKFTHLLMILLIAQVLLLAFDVEQLRGVAGEGYMISYNVFTILPVLQIVFCRLATAGIKKDEALVRSADRLR